jgi:hypothetical protein
MVDFAGLMAERQREVGASGAALLAGGAVDQGRSRRVMLRCSVTHPLPGHSSDPVIGTAINGRQRANMQLAAHCKALLLVP